MPTRVTRDAFSGTPTPTGLGVVRRDARRRDASPRRARASAFARARAPVRRDARRARARPISAARRPWRRTRTRRGLRAPGKTPPARLARGLITDPPSVDASARGARAPGHDAPRAGSRGRGAGDGGRASRAARGRERRLSVRFAGGDASVVARRAVCAATHHRPRERLVLACSRLRAVVGRNENTRVCACHPLFPSRRPTEPNPLIARGHPGERVTVQVSTMRRSQRTENQSDENANRADPSAARDCRGSPPRGSTSRASPRATAAAQRPARSPPARSIRTPPSGSSPLARALPRVPARASAPPPPAPSRTPAVRRRRRARYLFSALAWTPAPPPRPPPA